MLMPFLRNKNYGVIKMYNYEKMASLVEGICDGTPCGVCPFDKICLETTRFSKEKRTRAMYDGMDKKAVKKRLIRMSRYNFYRSIFDGIRFV